MTYIYLIGSYIYIYVHISVLDWVGTTFYIKVPPFQGVLPKYRVVRL